MGLGLGFGLAGGDFAGYDLLGFRGAGFLVVVAFGVAGFEGRGVVSAEGSIAVAAALLG